MKRIIVCLLLSIQILQGQAQEFCNPLGIPMYLSGSFAELRTNHFHSGLDIKTQGKEGLEVFAVADGWVSRIKVSPWGFGHALYITHNNGYTSVYAHLSRFSNPISEYVLKQQYKRKSFSVDVYLKKGQIPVKQSDVVAYTGNSGGSGGPHLHFELRNSATQKPLNPLKFNFDIKDNLPPILKKLSVLEYGTTNYYNVRKQNASTYVLDTIDIASNSPSLAISLSDYANQSRNCLGINHITMYLDNEKVFEYQMESFAFSQSRYINAHINYPYFIQNHERFQKLFVEKGNRLEAYPLKEKYDFWNGNDVRNVKIVVSDSKQNASILSFVVKKQEGSLLDISEQNGLVFAWNKSNHFKNENFELNAPKGAFYQDCVFESSVKKDAQCLSGQSYQIALETIAVHNKIDLNIPVPKDFRGNPNKISLVQLEGNKIAAIDSYFEQGQIKAKIRKLGVFGLMMDTVSPSIRLITKKPDYKYKAFVFKIADDLSGIKKYSAFLNGEWILFKYDYKTKQYYYDRDFRLKKIHSKQILKIVVSDAKGNRNEKIVQFVY